MATLSTLAREGGAYAPATWRLVVDPEPRSGAANMAIDEAMAEACAAGESPPTLRFYRWDPPTVSLGRHQAIGEIDRQAVQIRGYDVVRRSTGGRAILHTDELTYSVVAPVAEERVQGGVMDAYLRLSNALVAGLASLGFAVEKAAGSVRAGSDVSAACFEVPSAYEITAGGKKLMGSAQSRRAGYVLQHGSLPLWGDITRLVEILALPEAEQIQLRIQLADRACTLAQALGVEEDSERIRFETVAQSLVQGFQSQLQLRFTQATLSAGEIRQAARLVRERFANPEWTHRR